MAAVRAISQAGLYPANARLIERDEAKSTEAGDGTYDLLVLRDKFLLGPYLREHAIARGVMRDTMESCVTWDRYMEFQAQVKEETLGVIREVTGRPGTCTVRFTHLYPDGPAPYFTWHALGDKDKLVEQFWAIKAAASEAMTSAGGTITHHHALGRDHRLWYDRERPELFADALKAVKRQLDPHQILNPGVLVDS